MNYFVSKIVSGLSITAFIIAVILGFGVIPESASAQTGCTVISSLFEGTEPGETYVNLGTHTLNQTAKLITKTVGCDSTDSIVISFKEADLTNYTDDPIGLDIILDPTLETQETILRIAETGCSYETNPASFDPLALLGVSDGADCDIEVYAEVNNVAQGRKGTMGFDCTTISCQSDDQWSLVLDPAAYNNRCVVTNAAFNPSGNAFQAFNLENPQEVEVIFSLANCTEGDVIQYKIVQTNSINTTISDTANWASLDASSNVITVRYSIGEKACAGAGAGCNYYIQFRDELGIRWSVPSSQGNLTYDRATSYGETEWVRLDTSNNSSLCIVTDARFDISENPSLNNGTYNQELPQKAAVVLTTTGCNADDSIYFSIYEISSFLGVGTPQPLGSANNIRINDPEPTERFEYIVGEEHCSVKEIYGGIDTDYPHCVYNIEVKDELHLNGHAFTDTTNEFLRYKCGGPNDSYGKPEPLLSVSTILEYGSIFGQLEYLTGNANHPCNFSKLPWRLTSGGVDTAVDLSSVGLFSIDVNDPCYDQTTGKAITGCYTLLQPIPFFGTSINAGDTNGGGFKIGTYINTLIQVVIGLLGILAVLMITWAGVQYMFTDVVSMKGDAKERIQNALLGLLIALGAYMLLITINPDLINLTPEISNVKIVVDEIQEDGSSLQITYSADYQPNTACPGESGKEGDTCVEIPQSIVVKNRTNPQGQKADQVEISFLSRLQQMDQELQANGMPWRVTEAWKPSRVHKAICHQIGTCIDANHTDGDPPAEKVAQFITIAAKYNMCAVYEAKRGATIDDTQAWINELVASSPTLTTDNVKNYHEWITGSHYSVYNGTCANKGRI